jgi:hypothetical protein
MRKSEQQIRRGQAEAARERDKLKSKLRNQRRGGSVMDPAFARQLEAKGAAVRAGQPAAVRRDLPDVIEKLRAEGKLPTSPEAPGRVGYVPTPEEILGDDALPTPTTPPPPAAPDRDCPPADSVLELGAGTYGEGDLSPEEVAEIDRLNPRRAQNVAQPGRAMHTPAKRPKGR